MPGWGGHVLGCQWGLRPARGGQVPAGCTWSAWVAAGLCGLAFTWAGEWQDCFFRRLKLRAGFPAGAGPLLLSQAA